MGMQVNSLSQMRFGSLSAENAKAVFKRFEQDPSAVLMTGHQIGHSNAIVFTPTKSPDELTHSPLAVFHKLNTFA